MTRKEVTAAYPSPPEEYQRVHRLVDRLPLGDLHTAARVIEGLLATCDPLLITLQNALDEDETITATEQRAVAAARADIDPGRVVALEDAERALSV